MSRGVVKDFIGKDAPPGYIAGVGRGATGFTTRSDIGPAREASGPSRSGAGDSGPPRKLQKRDDDEEEDLNDTNYDEFEGYGGSLFNNDPYDKEDEEADKTYSSIDKHVDERGKALREAKNRQELELYRTERPKIQQQFSDLKSELKNVSEEEWMSIPDVGDARNRKQRVGRQDKYTPVPDTLLAHQARLATGGERVVYLDPETEKNNYDSHVNELEPEDDNPQPGLSSSIQDTKSDSTVFDRLNIGMMSELRGSYMSMTLSNASDATGKDNLQNPQEYLMNLESIPTQITDESTLKLYRKNFESLRTSNPDCVNAWIASARLEEAAGKLKAAQKLIRQACEQNPDKDDLWCEASRLHPTEVAKGLLFKALELNPKSVKLWLRAAELEKDPEVKRRVFKLARKKMPDSAVIWKKSVELEIDFKKPDEARVLLREAFSCCPDEVDFCLALARMEEKESYEEAQMVLIEGSKRNPKEKAIWLMAAKLEESRGNVAIVSSIVERLLEQAIEDNETLDIEVWLREAVEADKALGVDSNSDKAVDDFNCTCRELVRQVMEMNLISSKKKKKVKFEQQPAGETQASEQQKLATYWLEMASKISSQSTTVARSIYQTLVAIGHEQAKQSCLPEAKNAKPSLEPRKPDEAFPFNKMEAVWMAWIEFERLQGTKESHSETLRLSIRTDNCAKCDKLWLMLAREMRDQNLFDACEKTLCDALDANPDSEAIILAAVELECDRGNNKKARKILADARMSTESAQLVMRSAKLEWDLHNLDEAVRMLRDGTKQYKDYGLFYLSLGQIEEQRQRHDEAKGHYKDGIKNCPNFVDLWLSRAALEERLGNIALARSILKSASIKNPKSVRVWLEFAKFEMRQYQTNKQSGKLKASSSPKEAISLLDEGLKRCKGEPKYNELVAEKAAISQRKFT